MSVAKRRRRACTPPPPQPASSSRRLSLSPDWRGAGRAWPPTPDDIRTMFGPPKTLGAPDDVQLAMDARLADSGIYSLLQHTLETGMGVAPQFMGYGALQNLTQNGMIRTCVETVADDMTRAWIALKREGEGDDALLTEAAQALTRHDLQRLFHEAAELVGYEGGAFIFIDTGVSGPALESPLNRSPYSGELRPGGALRFTVVDPVNVFPGDYDSLSPLSPDYFRPRWWWVLGQRVHASRLIRLAANELPVLLRPAYNFLGIPQAQILWDYVLHFQECRAAAARLLTKFSLTVFKTSMADILFASGGTAQLDARIRYMAQAMSNDGVLAVDKDAEDVIKLETPLSGVTDIVRQSLELLAAVNRTPAVKLLGISPSGFNATGESDIRNYYDHISSQQEKVLRPGIQTALDCLQLHLRGDIDPGLTFDFAPLGEEDRAALAMQQKTRADTLAVYLDRDVISPEEARKTLADDPDSGFAATAPDDAPEGDGMPDTPDALPGVADIDDADTAGTASDAAFEEGKHPRDKGGKFTQGGGSGTGKGNAAKREKSDIRTSTPLESAAPDTARYAALVKEHGGDHKKAAHAYYREKLQGRHVTAQTDEGPIEACFTGAGWGELKKNMAKDPVKAALVPHLPDIIATGTYAREAPVHEHPDVPWFHTYTKTVQTSVGPKEAIVDVAERKRNTPPFAVYSLTREGSHGYEDRKKAEDTKETVASVVSSGHWAGRNAPPYPVAPDLIMDGNDGFLTKKIAPFFEVVNIRFADEGRADG